MIKLSEILFHISKLTLKNNDPGEKLILLFDVIDVPQLFLYSACPNSLNNQNDTHNILNDNTIMWLPKYPKGVVTNPKISTIFWCN